MELNTLDVCVWHICELFLRGRWRGLVAADVKVVCRLGSRAMGGIAGTASTAAREAKLIEREFETMKGLAHPNVVQVHNSFLL